jgi:hypothetical protein
MPCRWSSGLAVWRHRLALPGTSWYRQHLLAAFLKRHILEAALHLGPLGASPRAQMLGIAVDRLVQDGQKQERALRTSSGLGQFLQDEHVAPIGVAGPVLKEFAQLIDDQQDTGGVVTEALQIGVRLLEKSDDCCAAGFRLMGQLLQSLDDLIRFRPGDAAKGRSETGSKGLLQGLARPRHQHRAKPPHLFRQPGARTE